MKFDFKLVGCGAAPATATLPQPVEFRNPPPPREEGQEPGPRTSATDPMQRWVDAVQLFRFPLACAVLAVHAAGVVAAHQAKTGAEGMGGASGWVVEFVTMICRLATPSFLLIAGLVFFRNGPVSDLEYRRKLNSRVGTLLVPYFAWNLIAVLVLCAPSALKQWAGGGSSAAPEVTFSNLQKWFIGWPIFPADAPLWFVRDLLILLLVAPVLSLVSRRVQLAGILGLTGYWLLGPPGVIPGGIPRASSAIFFLAGAWMGLNRVVVKPCAATRKMALMAGTVFIGACALGAGCSVSGPGYEKWAAALEKVIRLSGALMVVCGVVNISLSQSAAAVLRRLSGTSFFIYASHFCVLIVLSMLLKHISAERWGIGSAPMLFLLVFLACLGTCLACHSWLKRNAPSLLAVLDGNRSRVATCSRRKRAKDLAVGGIPGRGVFPI